MGLFKPKQDCDSMLREVVTALMMDDTDRAGRDMKRLMRFPPKDLIAALGGYGFDMRSAGVSDALIAEAAMEWADDDEPARSAFLAFAEGVFSGVADTAVAAAKTAHSNQTPEQFGDFVSSALFVAARIAQRHDLPI